MKIISSLFAALLILISLAFAVSNRQNATISLWPFDMQVEAPLYLLTLGTLLLGLLFGAMFAWFGMLPHRFEARRLRKDISNLHDKLEELQRIVTPAPVYSDGLLPLPKRSWKFWRRS